MLVRVYGSTLVGVDGMLVTVEVDAGRGLPSFQIVGQGDRVVAAYGPNHQRMVQLKKKFDPTNLFRLNQNVDPAG